MPGCFLQERHRSVCDVMSVSCNMAAMRFVESVGVTTSATSATAATAATPGAADSPSPTPPPVVLPTPASTGRPRPVKIGRPSKNIASKPSEPDPVTDEGGSTPARDVGTPRSTPLPFSTKGPRFDGVNPGKKRDLQTSPSTVVESSKRSRTVVDSRPGVYDFTGKTVDEGTSPLDEIPEAYGVVRVRALIPFVSSDVAAEVPELREEEVMPIGVEPPRWRALHPLRDLHQW